MSATPGAPSLNGEADPLLVPSSSLSPAFGKVRQKGWSPQRQTTLEPGRSAHQERLYATVGSETGAYRPLGVVVVPADDDGDSVASSVAETPPVIASAALYSSLHSGIGAPSGAGATTGFMLPGERRALAAHQRPGAAGAAAAAAAAGGGALEVPLSKTAAAQSAAAEAAELSACTRELAAMTADGAAAPKLARLVDLVARLAASCDRAPENYVVRANLATAQGFTAQRVLRATETSTDSIPPQVTDVGALLRTALANARTALQACRLANAAGTSAARLHELIVCTNVGVLCSFLARQRSVTASEASQLYEEALAALSPVVQEQAHVFHARMVLGICILGQVGLLSGSVRTKSLAEAIGVFAECVAITPTSLRFLQLWMDVFQSLTVEVARMPALMERVGVIMDAVHVLFCRFVFARSRSVAFQRARFFNMRTACASGKEDKAFWQTMRDEARIVGDMTAAVSEADQGACTYVGFLYKRGARVKSFKRRLFVLTLEDPFIDSVAGMVAKAVRGSLDYYEGKKVKGSIAAAEMTGIVEVSDAALESKLGVQAGGCFTLTTRDREYLLIAQNGTERGEWIKALTPAIALVRSLYRLGDENLEPPCLFDVISVDERSAASKPVRPLSA